MYKKENKIRDRIHRIPTCYFFIPSRNGRSSRQLARADSNLDRAIPAMPPMLEMAKRRLGLQISRNDNRFLPLRLSLHVSLQMSTRTCIEFSKGGSRAMRGISQEKGTQVGWDK